MPILEWSKFQIPKKKFNFYLKLFINIVSDIIY